jgi:predicted transcriptional regulator of viral defense system
MSYHFHEIVRPRIRNLATEQGNYFTIHDVAEVCGVTFPSATYHVRLMMSHGEVERAERGAYQLADDRSDRVTAPDPRITALKDAWRTCESTALTAKQAETAFLKLAREIAQG